MVNKINLCKWCRGDGYFGDFGPGLYPLPCPSCAGTGLENVISTDILKNIIDMRQELHERIKVRTERLDIASLAFEAGVRAGLANTIDSIVKYEKRKQDLLKRLAKFPQDYIEVEKDSLKEGWERAIKLVDEPYKTNVVQNSRNVLGNTYKENIFMDLENAKIRRVVITE